MTDRQTQFIIKNRLPVITGGGLGICEMAGVSLLHFQENPVVGIHETSKCPKKDELLAIREAIPTTFMRSYKPEIIEDVMRAPIPVLQGHNTYLLRKCEDGGWRYHRPTWAIGPFWAPGPRLTLDELLENIRNRGVPSATT